MLKCIRTAGIMCMHECILHTWSITCIFNSCFRFDANLCFCCCCCCLKINAQTTSECLVLLVHVRHWACMWTHGAPTEREWEIGQVNKNWKETSTKMSVFIYLFTFTFMLRRRQMYMCVSVWPLLWKTASHIATSKHISSSQKDFET